ncbi:hypothetical protein Tco_1431950 [Tanacetum coccineum]
MQSEESTKRQKIKDDVEKEELKAYLDLVPREEFAMEIKSLATKYSIVNSKTRVLTENFMYYQIFKADGSSKNYKIFSEMLDDFDRQDGDLKILFEPDEEDEVWRNQHEYNLISWRLFDSCGIHILLMNNGISIHMMIEKKAIGVSSRVCKGKGAISFWAGPNLVVWARYAFWARGHVATNCRSKKREEVSTYSRNAIKDVKQKTRG